MRTLILNKFLHRNGGSETYIFKLGEALEQHGHEVQYFGMEHEGRCVEKLIREARFSIYPSEWYENCPFSVMESQMYGTPVLGADIGGIPELIQVGKTGELFESGNGEDLKKKVEKLWGDKKLCEQYSKNCKDISFDTIDEYYEKIMKVYR